MPTVFTRTFALLSSTKPPIETCLNNHILQEPQSIEEIQHISIELEEPAEKPDMSIWKAAEQGNKEALQHYIENNNGIDLTTLLNTRDPDTDCTLLHLVISHARYHKSSLFSLLKLLLENGADVTARDVYNVQAIHMVSLYCPNQPLPCIDLLLNHKANPNARDGDGWTPLHYAARFCQPPDPVIHLLVSRGSDVNQRDAGRKTALFGLLANGDRVEALDWLIHSAKADLTLLGDLMNPITRQTQPSTLVLQATKYGRTECLALLIRSKLAISQLRKVVSHEELKLACQFVKDNHPMQILLQELSDTLERDPASLLYTPILHQHIQRHSSVMTVLGIMRRGSNGKLFRKVNQFMKRTKHEREQQQQQNK
ncbi:hypothetical protein G6F37_000213 [Rhizopus arrhizus]|nr:hypothetical protein G6F38_000575 [Rhizopus arrhizus]KAG1164503.1 hypothetical protein G6F37_000213 [Rhizopus arrhizus]